MTVETSLALATRASDALLLCRGESDLLAIPLRHVTQVVSARSILRIPGAPRAVLGVTSVDTRLVTVVDLAEMIGSERAPTEQVRRGRVVLVDEGRGELGLWVRAVVRVFQTLPGSIEAPGTWSRPHVGGFFRAPGEAKVATVLSLEHVLDTLV